MLQLHSDESGHFTQPELPSQEYHVRMWAAMVTVAIKFGNRHTSIENALHSFSKYGGRSIKGCGLGSMNI